MKPSKNGLLQAPDLTAASLATTKEMTIEKKKTTDLSIPNGGRKIASNSRIRRDEQNKRDMYLAFVNNALKAKVLGNSGPFDELVAQFSTTQADYSQLKRWILALSHVVSQIDKRHAALVEALVYMPWTTNHDEAFVKCYISFIGMLVSARTEWLSIVVASAARRLTHHCPLNAPPRASQSTPTPTPVPLRSVFNRVHLLIQSLLELFPTLPATLPTHLLRHFPHKAQSTTSLTVYCKNLVEIMSYCSQLVEPVLSLMIERAVGIDVEIQVELEELEELTASNESSGAVQSGTGLLADFDPFDILAGQESDSDDEEDGEEEAMAKLQNIDTFSDVSSEADNDERDDDVVDPKEAEKRALRVKEMVAKLDGMMNILLRWLEKTTPEPSDGSAATQHPHFVTLLAIFDRIILTTFKSRYTQFLLFYIVSSPWAQSTLVSNESAPLHTQVQQNPPNAHADIFLGSLLHNALVPQTPPIPMLTRIASAAYLSSFVSRALCIGKDDCRSVVIVCCQWADGHMEELEALMSGSSAPLDAATVNAHDELGVFYAVAQAIFLIFCFRWRDLLEQSTEDDPDEAEEAPKKWIHELNVVQRLITSPLNPLKICSPNVVHQFSRVSEKAGFAYCRSIIEGNKRSLSLMTSQPALALAPLTPVGDSSNGNLAASGTPLNAWNSSAVLSVMTDLQSFFPFDPYRLPTSSKWFEGTYRDWSMVAIEDDEEEEESDDEEENILAVGSAPRGGEGDSDNQEEENSESSDEGSDEDATYGVAMELGSVRERGNTLERLQVAESFGQMSISPDVGGIHRSSRG